MHSSQVIHGVRYGTLLGQFEPAHTLQQCRHAVEALREMVTDRKQTQVNHDPHGGASLPSTDAQPTLQVGDVQYLTFRTKHRQDRAI